MLRKSDNLNELAKALAVAQGAMEAAKKDKNNPAFGKASKYADLASIWDAVREPLAKNGLSVVQLPFTDETGRVNISTLLMHSSGQWIETSYYLLPTKQDPQGFGSAITYMKRYALTGMGVAPEDDDGNAASAGASGGQIDPRPPLERPKQSAANGNGNGAHKDDKAAALKWVSTSVDLISRLGKRHDIELWEDKNKDTMAKLKALDIDLYDRVTDAVEKRFLALNTLNAG